MIENAKHAKETLRVALAAFEAGRIGERELIAIIDACSVCMDESLKHPTFSKFIDDARAALKERVRELGAQS